MRCIKYVITLVLVIALMGCELLESPVSINNDVIDAILQSENSLESVFYSLQKEANIIGLELTEIEIKYQGKENIHNKEGICRIELFKEAHDTSNDFFYEGGKVEVVNIIFMTDSRGLIENNDKFDHGRAAHRGGHELKIEEWRNETEAILNLYINKYNNEINELENPILSLTIYNDRCLVNLWKNKTVYIHEEYDMKSQLK